MAAIANADEVQALIDTALAAQAVITAGQQQALVDAAVATAIAAQQQPPAPPVVFSLTPGVANPTIPWNYSSPEGIKLYHHAVSPLSPVYKGDERALKVFLSGLTSKALQFGWEPMIMMIPDGSGVVRNLLKSYTLLTSEDIKKHALTYIGQPTRASQASTQLAGCILVSLDADFLIKLLTRQKDYMVEGVEHGPAMLKAVVSIVTIETKSAVPLIKKELGDLRVTMKDVKSDITEFNLRVCELMNRLYAADEDYSELLDKLFEAYQSASDKAFVSYIADKQSRWEDNELDLNAVGFMALAGNYYKTRITRKTWNTWTKEEDDIIAMRAELVGVVALNAELMTKINKKPGKKDGGRVYDAKWDWKKGAPTGDQATEKSFEGKDYVYCPFHQDTKWVLKKNHADGCRNDPKHAKPPVTSGTSTEPNKKVLQYAKALLSVMEPESDGEMVDESI
jgi:hypothetical protein